LPHGTIMQPLDPSELKALFAQLVDAIGTQDAAAAFLGISRQRVGQLIGTSWPDLPTILQVVKLEAVCGQAVVTGALARRVEGEQRADALSTGVRACAAASVSLSALHDAQSDGLIDLTEHKSVATKAREALDAAQAHYDAVMAARPKLEVVG